METPLKFIEWLTNMGYQGKIPHNLQRIYNPSTAIIWEQLVHKTRPKQEVEYIRNNILIKRLRKNDNTAGIPELSMFHDKSDYPIKELVVWDKKQTLKQHIDSAKFRLDELCLEVTNINKQNKIKCTHLDNIKEKIHEHCQFTLLLNTKATELETEINNSEELLKQARNSTPIEQMEQNGDDDVMNTLKMCSEKLYKILDQQKGVTNNINSGVPLANPEFSISTVYSKEILDDSLGLLDGSMSFTNAAAASSFISTCNFSSYSLPILNDAHLNKSLEGQLHSKDRRTIWNVISHLSETSKIELIDAIAENYKIAPSSTKKANKEEKYLYELHVEYELKARKLLPEIQVLKEDLKDSLNNLMKKCPEHTQHKLKINLQKVGVTAVSQQIQELINKMQCSFNIQNDRRIAVERATTLQDNIDCTLNNIKHKLAILKEVLDTMFQTRNKIAVLVRQLAPFTLDLNWTMALDSSINSVEIKTFLDFPLEYNRALINGDKKTYVRNISLNCIPYQGELDSKFTYMLLAVLQNPSVPTEVLLIDIIKTTLRMNHLKTLQYVPEPDITHKYTLDDLQNQDVHLNYALDKLKYFLSSNSDNRTGYATLSHLKHTLNLWLEMPIKDFVSNNQLCNGKTYEYYEKLFLSYYTQL